MTKQTAMENDTRQERREQSLFDGWALALVLPLLLALAFFGAVHKAIWAGLVIFAGLGLVALSVRQLRTGRVEVHPRKVLWILAPAAAALVFGTLQFWPTLPGELAHPLWTSAAVALEVPVTARVTLTPADTLDVLLRLSSYLAVFWITLQFSRSPRRARLVLQLLVIGIGFFAIYGLVIFFSGLEMILWLQKYAYLNDLTGTLINRNTAATVLGMGWLGTTALLLGELHKRFREVEVLVERRRRTTEYLFGSGLWFTGLWAVLLAALLLTHSRAGMASSLAGLGVMLAFVLSQRFFGRSGRFATAILVLLGLGLVIHISDGLTLDRLKGTEISEEERFDAYNVVLQAIEDAPVVGTGLGSFQEVFRIYQPTRLLGQWAMAHSSYLENALEGGVIWAGVVALTVLVGAVLCLFGALRRRREMHYPLLGLAVAVQVGLHSLIDFSLQIPAVSAITACILGIGVAQSWSSRENLGSLPENQRRFKVKAAGSARGQATLDRSVAPR